MTSETTTIRPLTPHDGPLLRTATLANVNWRGGQRFTERDLDRTPDLRHYCALVPERGDFGLVAERDGLVVGVVWLLFLGGDDPGYGFVGDGVPELSISVWSGHRRQGIGRALMRAALVEARRRGLDRISLSVEAGNPSVRLYREVGFLPVTDAASGTMVLDLASRSTHGTGAHRGGSGGA